EPLTEARIAIARAELDNLEDCVIGRERIEAIIRLFRETGDAAGEARAWYALVGFSHGHAQFVQGGEAARQMLQPAKRSGSRELVDQAVRAIASAIGRGPGPVSELRPQVRALLDEVKNPSSKGRIFMYLSEMEAREGHFDRARDLMQEGLALAPSDDEGDLESCMSPSRTRLEMLAGEPARAEAISRKACADLERRGLIAFLASELPMLADTLSAQGRFDEADAGLTEGGAIVVPSAVAPRQGRPRARARVRRGRGVSAAAEGSIRDARGWVREMEDLDATPETRLEFARVLYAGGHDDEARDA